MRAVLVLCLLTAALAACDGAGSDSDRVCAAGLPALSAETFRALGPVRFAMQSGAYGAGTVTLTPAGWVACSRGAFVARVEVTEEAGGPVPARTYDVSFGPTGLVAWPFLYTGPAEFVPAFRPGPARGVTVIYGRGSGSRYHSYTEEFWFVAGRGLVLHRWGYAEIDGQPRSYVSHTLRRTD